MQRIDGFLRLGGAAVRDERRTGASDLLERANGVVNLQQRDQSAAERRDKRLTLPNFSNLRRMSSRVTLSAILKMATAGNGQTSAHDRFSFQQRSRSAAHLSSCGEWCRECCARTHHHVHQARAHGQAKRMKANHADSPLADEAGALHDRKLQGGHGCTMRRGPDRTGFDDHCVWAIRALWFDPRVCIR